MAPPLPGGCGTLVRASYNGERVYCNVNTRNRRVQLVRGISGSACREGQTWGWGRRGIRVDGGCQLLAAR